MSAAADLLNNYQHVIEELQLIPQTGGVFEVQVGDALIYSKKGNGRHAEPGEVLQLFTEHVGASVPRYA